MERKATLVLCKEHSVRPRPGLEYGPLGPESRAHQPPTGGGGGGARYIGDIGMCSPKGYGFSAVLVINRVSILAYSGHFGHN